MTHPISHTQPASKPSRAPKKIFLKVLFPLTIIFWCAVTIMFFHSCLINNTDGFRSHAPLKHQKREYIPRLIYLGTTDELIEHTHKLEQQIVDFQADEYSLKQHAYIASDIHYKQVEFREKIFDKECVAMSSWQESSFPNCNQIHEIGILSKLVIDEFHYIESGGWNDVFKILDSLGLDPTLALKKLSPRRGKEGGLTDKYKLRNYERVRQDAIILDHLSRSKHVMDIFGHCGMAIIVPYADGGTLEEKILKLSRRNASKERLKLMVDAARGLANLHGDDTPSIVHGDLTSRQYMFVNGIQQLGDFNQAILMRRNTSDDTTCTYNRIDRDYGVFRSPEEYSHLPQTTAVDVWALGSIIYHILTGKKVWKSQFRKRDAEKAMIRGELPVIEDTISNSSDPVDQALLKAFYMCYTHDPQKRPSAKEVATFLQERWAELNAIDA